ncbi:hypothetical protein V8E54_008784 [Elaphomyces granulatus]
MAQTMSPQVPQHVFTLLSHLSSRPGVQSTLILSRKDGSIIQSTGLLAPSQTQPQPRRNAVPSGEMSVSSPSEPASSSNDAPNLPDLSSINQQPYKPSQAEALAAHIHAFVLSASALGVSLSHPPSTTSFAEDGYRDRLSNVNGVEEGVGNGTVDEDVEEAENRDKEEGDEVKLLRLRTKKHEIVVVPDRRYLLCVVHDTSGMLSTASGGGGFFSPR